MDTYPISLPRAMRAVFFTGQGLRLEERPVPEPGPGEALVRVRLVGICNTDLELFQGYYGFTGIAGHEFIGEVAAAPDAPEWQGRRVTAEINCGCGQCPGCLQHDPRHCATRTVLGIVGRDGAFAQYLTVPVANLHAIPDSLPDERAVFTEPLAAALNVAEQTHLTPRTRLAVLGDGKLGLLAACSLRMFCPQLTLIGKHVEKLAIAEAHQVNTRLIQGAEDLPALIDELGRFQVVVEATGSEQGPAAAINLLEPQGTLVAKTTSRNLSQLDMAKVVVDEIRIQGSRCGDFAWALAFLAQGLVDVAPLVQGVYDLHEFETAFEAARTRGAMKVLVRMD